uniref:Uncharacterized protein n=1 Tax=Panagrolaimus sp. ES5 TaxID=591445 RepID=A0AC34GMY1_9BILA
EQSQLSSILTPLGVENNQETDEFQMGRDKTITILGMPLGRRDGISLSPSKGLSYGNQNMLGPIAVNDKYNLQWDFLNKIQAMFVPSSEGKPNFGNLIQLFAQRQ